LTSYYFGDAHLSALNPYNILAGENFLRWFDAQTFDKDSYAFFAGDITERDTNPGIVIAQLIRLLMICHEKFKYTYIVLGNHDVKSYKGLVQNSLMFVPQTFDNIIVIDDLTAVYDDDGNLPKVLCMPHRYNEDFIKRYNDYLKAHADEEWDAIVGHFYATESFSGDYVDVSKVKAKVKAIGHVHTRIAPEYLGSLWPNSSSEDFTPYPRAIRCLKDGIVSEIPLPKFLQFVKVDFGEELPQTETPNTVYIINNASLEDAKQKYGQDKFIKVGKLKAQETATVSSLENVSTSEKSNLDYFNDMITELKLQPSRSAYKAIMTLLSN